jgi:hypothetical protein
LGVCIKRHKAQLVSKGFFQVEGIDYNETFAHIAKMNSIHLVLSLDASHISDVHQMDVKYLAWRFARINWHGITSWLCPK